MKKKKKMSGKKKLFLFIFLGIFLSLGIFAAYFFLSLPDVAHLRTENPKTTALMEQRKQEAKAKGKSFHIKQKWVSFDDIPKLLKYTVRISEDDAFYQHNGIDFNELKEAIKKNLSKGKKARGGSTITQQLAKNLFLSTKKSYYRKVTELFIARRLEANLSKDRIFCIYLNVIEFGRGIFGVEAAANEYFKKTVSQLKLEEILRLTAVIPKPLRITPHSNGRYMKWRANLLLERLRKYDYISDQEYHRTKHTFRK